MNEIPEIEIVQVGSIKQLEEGEIQQMVDLIISTVPLSRGNDSSCCCLLHFKTRR